MGFKSDERDDSAGKIFIGGLPRETTESSLVRHFEKYGEIIDKVIMMDKFTGQPRGFGFITFSDPSLVDIVLQNSHTIHGKTVEIKRTIPRRNSGQFYSNDNTNNNYNNNIKTKKIFVGGIPITLADDEFGDFFTKYGEITDYQIIKDHETNRSRGFGFVAFESEESVDYLLSNGNMIDLYGFQVEVKRAEPKKSSHFQPKARSFGKNEYNNGFDNQTGFGPVMKNPTRLAGRLSYTNGYSYLTDPLLGFSNAYYYNSGFGSVLGGYGQVNPFYTAGTGYGLSGSGGAGYGMRGTGYGSNGGRYHPYGR
ncbi:hypothetical protein LUZ60_003265 [Juncus effusus]|nr:hypothetical protein LUZ60_003265 [Juncus effusus]